MAEMRAALGADDLLPSHAVGVIDPDLDSGLIHGIPEAGPARSGFVLGLRFEQLGSAADADVGAVLLVLVVLAGEGEFRGLFLSHAPLFVGEAFLKV